LGKKRAQRKGGKIKNSSIGGTNDIKGGVQGFEREGGGKLNVKKTPGARLVEVQGLGWSLGTNNSNKVRERDWAAYHQVSSTKRSRMRREKTPSICETEEKRGEVLTALGGGEKTWEGFVYKLGKRV